MNAIVPKQKSQVELLKDLIDDLNQVSGAASQLIHMLPDPRFLIIRETVTLMKEACMDLARKGISMGEKTGGTIIV